MGLVRAWRRQIYGASLVAILIPAAIIAALFIATGGGPLQGLGTLGQVFSGPAIPGGNLSARVSENSKPALPGSGGAGAAALRGHSPVIGQAPTGGAPPLRSSSGPHGSAVAPLSLGTTPTAPSSGGQLNGGSAAGGGNHNPTPRPPSNPTTTTTATATSTTTTDGTTAASLPPIVAVPPPPITTTTTTPTTATTTTTVTTPVHTTTTTTTTKTTTTSTTKTTTTPTTKTTTTSTTKTTTTPTTKTTTTPTTKTTTTTTVTRTTTTIKAPTTKTGTRPIGDAAPVATTVAQAERGSAVFTGCAGDWGLA